MSGSQKALEYFAQNYNCAQSALIGCGHLTGLETEAALKVAGGFGGGMRVGSVCGAATGALMALGCLFPFTDSTRPEDKDRINQKAAQFLAAFKAAHGHLDCECLVAGDPNFRENICPGLVAWAVGQVEAMAAEQP